MSGQPVRAFEDARALARAAAEEILSRATTALAARGVFHLALSGGSTPRHAYAELGRRTRDADLSRWHIWFGDERCVPPDHPESNHRMASEVWLSASALPPAQVHRMRGEEDPPAEAERYERELYATLGTPPRLDLVLLGLGADGHTASLFPAAESLHEGRRLVRPALASRPPRERVTLTFAAINLARVVLFLVSGAEKARSLADVLARRGSVEELPALAVDPQEGRVLWFADRAALSLARSPAS